jgi:hypothetical protein
VNRSSAYQGNPHPGGLSREEGSAPHVNNVELGKRGRWRSNVWTYPDASSLCSDARRGLKDHPTVKPTAMLEDARPSDCAIAGKVR